MKTPSLRTFLPILASALFVGLALFSAALRAEETPQPSATDSAETERAPMSGPGDEKAVEAFFDEPITKQLREEPVAGATVAVVKDGRLVFAKGYGHSDREQHEPVVADESLFYPGSAGKLFTWTAVMQIAEEGKLDLDIDINTYLDFEIPDTYPEPITLAHLMTHTAGFEEPLAALFVCAATSRRWSREYGLALRGKRA